MFIASQTSRWVYGCPVNWETPLRIYIITSWCKLLTLSLSLCFILSHLFLFGVTFNTFPTSRGLEKECRKSKIASNLTRSRVLQSVLHKGGKLYSAPKPRGAIKKTASHQ